MFSLHVLKQVYKGSVSSSAVGELPCRAKVALLLLMLKGLASPKGCST